MGDREFIEGYEKDAVDVFKEWLVEHKNDTDPNDAIFEAVDGSRPIYNSTILELAANDFELASAEPSIGPAFDGSPTPINIIAANIFERLESACWDFWRSDCDLVDCPACNGTGKALTDDEEEIECPQCDGVGQLYEFLAEEWDEEWDEEA